MTRRLSAALLALTLIAAACGTEAEPAPSVASTAAPAESSTTTAAATTTASTAAAAPSTTAASTDSNASPAGGNTLGATVLAQAPDLTTTSGRFEVAITMVGDGTEFEGEISLGIAGAFAENGDAEFSMDFGPLLEAGGEDIPEEFADVFAEPMQMKQVGDKAYVKWGFFAMFLGTDKWIETDADNSESVTSGFGFGTDGDSPTELLDALADANADIEEIGIEEVRGVQTTHYRAVLDLEALAQNLTEEERAELESDLGELNVSDFPIDIWVGDDGLVYRYVMSFDGAVAGAEADGILSMSMSFEMWDYGADVVIEPPPADEIATEDEIGFSFDA